MEFTVQEIANILNGKVEGDPEIKIHGFSKIEEGKEGTLSFIANPKYTKYIYDTNASVVIVNNELSFTDAVKTTLIRVSDAYQSFAKLLHLADNHKIEEKGVSEKASISDKAKLGKDIFIADNVYIGKNTVIEDNVKILPNCYIGDHVIIKKNTLIFPGVKIYHNTQIGIDCIFHAGVVIGSDGFGFAPQTSNNYEKIPQVGNLIIEDQVEIGSNTCIDRATIGSTIIRKGVKLDNLIQVAHNVEIGENTVIAAQTGIAGSTKIGSNCMIGGQAGVTGHVKIADGTRAAAQTGIGGPVRKENTTLYGSPGFEYKKYQQSYVLFRKLPDLYKKINELENTIKELKEKK